MHRKVNSVLSVAVASTVISLTGGAVFAVVSTTGVPIAKNDIVLGLSVANTTQTLKQVQADLSTKNSGVVTGTMWNQPSIQSVEFDNLNGFRHSANGNLLGLNFGGATTGGTLATFGTHPITTGQTTAVASTLIYNFTGTGSAASTTNSPELGRVGGLSVAPNNTHIAVSSNELRTGTTGTQLGKLVVLDYSAGDGTGTSGSVTNYRSVEVPGLRTGTSSRTSSTSWLDSNNVMVVGGTTDFSSTGDLYKVTLGTDGSLTPTKVATNLFQGFNLTFTNVTYEPTVSPYMFVSGSGFSGGTINKLIAVDPNNNYAPVTDLLDFSPDPTTGAADGQVNTLREMAFDSKGNLAIGGFAGSTALGNDYVLKSLTNAIDTGTLTSASTRLVGIVQKQQTSDNVSTTTPPITGTSSSFNGLDVALTNIDYVNADVTTNVATGDYTQQYFGTTSPQAAIIAKIKAGTLTGDKTSGKGIGYVVTPAASGGTFRVKDTYLGDADLSGNVNFDDLVKLAQNYNGTGKVWVQGDFNYDGTVNFDDLVPLAQNYNKSLTPLQAAELGSSFASDYAFALSIVPEPTSLAALAMVGMVLRRNRAKA